MIVNLRVQISEKSVEEMEAKSTRSRKPMGRPTLHEEKKTYQLRAALTRTAERFLKEKSSETGLSLAELIEQWARGGFKDAA